jgi:hypothetical protein
MDEIGRGSAGDDGTSLAHAVTELVLAKGARSLFATHFHHIAPLLGFEGKAKGLIPSRTPREGVAFAATDVVIDSVSSMCTVLCSCAKAAARAPRVVVNIRTKCGQASTGALMASKSGKWRECHVHSSRWQRSRCWICTARWKLKSGLCNGWMCGEPRMKPMSICYVTASPSPPSPSISLQTALLS